MNEITLTTSNQTAQSFMTSLELVAFINADREQAAKDAGTSFPSKGFAELRHDNFMAKVHDVLGNAALKFQASYKDRSGRTLLMYTFPKREACLMAMSYSYELQAKVFDRMTELEVPLVSASQFNVPATFKDALKLAIEQCEVIEKQQAQVLQLSNEVKEAAPKVEFYNDVTDSTNWLDFTEASKALNYGRTGLYRFLRTIKMLMKDNLPMQKYVDSGHFKTNVYTYYTPNGVPAVGTKLYVSGKGLTLISKRVIENPQVASVMLKRVKTKES